MYRVAIVGLTLLLSFFANGASFGAERQAAISKSNVGYSSVAAALTALSSKPNVQIEKKDGWTVIISPQTKTV